MHTIQFSLHWCISLLLGKNHFTAYRASKSVSVFCWVAGNQLGETPLLFACGNHHPEMVNLLLGNWAYPSAAATDGTTPLHAAAESGNLEITNILLGGKADPQSQNSRLETPLYIAARGGHHEIIKKLFEK